MGAKTATTTGASNSSATTNLSPQVQAAYNSLLGQIGNLSNTSTANPSVSGASNGLSALSSTPNANYGTAGSTLDAASNPAYSSIGNYLSPYLTGALQTQIASQNQQNAQQQQGLIGNAAQQGALGGNRIGVAQSALAGQQDLANNQANSGLINSAYQQAENSALQGQSNQTAAGAAQTNLGSSQNASSLSNLLGLLGAGEYSQSAPYSNLGTLASSAQGLSNSGMTVNETGTSSQTQPVGNGLSSILGAVTSIAGLFNRGGTVPGYAAGGASSGDLMSLASSAGSNATQMAQQGMQSYLQSLQQQSQPTSYSGQQKQGAQNIMGLFHPQMGPVAGSEAGGMGSSYRRGGLVANENHGLMPRNDNRRGYDDGGLVQFPYAPDDYDDIDRQVVNAPQGILPALVGNSGVTVPQSVVSGVDSTPITPASINGLVHPSALQTGYMVPLTPQTAPAAQEADRAQQMQAQGFGPSSGPVPLAPLPTTAPTGLVPSPATSGASDGFSLNSAANAIRSMESGSAGGDYSSVGPVTKTGDRAYGAYQVMGANIPSWTAQYYGKPLTPAQFLSNPAAQDAVFKGQFSNYVSDYGPDGAAQAWFAGPKGMQNPNAADVNGTTVAGYGSKFASLLGNGPADGPQPSGLINGQVGTPAIASPDVSGVVPSGTKYGIPDSNAGYATNLRDVFSSLSQGKGLNLSPDARMGLVSAGLGMMAGTSPNAFANIGAGGQQGIQTWLAKQNLNRENALGESAIGAQQGDLGLAGQATTQAGESLYGQLQQMKADTQAAQAQATSTNVQSARNRFVPSPAGMMEFDPDNPSAPPKIIPYAQMMAPSNAPGTAVQSATPQPDADGFVTTAPPATSISPLLFNEQSAPIVYQQSQQALGGAQGDATNAQALNAQLGELSSLAKSLPDSGALAQGAGFDQRLSAVKGINSVLQTMGVAQVDPQDVATAEGMKKLATQLQFSVADAVKTDPAAATIAQAASASPSGENTKQGFARIVGNISALNKRSIDRYQFLQSWANSHYGDTSGADVTFNQLNPPANYIKYGQALTDNMLGTNSQSQSAPPAVGAVMQGYKFIGGDPSQQANWQKVP